MGFGVGGIGEKKVSFRIEERPDGIVFIAEGSGDESVLGVGCERVIAGCWSRGSGYKLLYLWNLCDRLCIEETFVKIGIDQLDTCSGVTFHGIVRLGNQLWTCLQLAKA